MHMLYGINTIIIIIIIIHYKIHIDIMIILHIK